MTTRREQTSGESRELILTAAAELFGTKGYRQTTFADVAERSGISRGSIPWHFGSKEGLLLAVLRQSVVMLPESLGGPPAPGAPAGPEHLMDGLATLFALPTTRMYVTLLVEALDPESPVHDRYVEIHDILRGHCRRWLEQFALPPSASTEALAVAIVGAGIGIHQQWLIAPDRVDLEQSLSALGTLVAAFVPAPAP